MFVRHTLRETVRRVVRPVVTTTVAGGLLAAGLAFGTGATALAAGPPPPTVRAPAKATCAVAHHSKKGHKAKKSCASKHAAAAKSTHRGSATPGMPTGAAAVGGHSRVGQPPLANPPPVKLTCSLLYDDAYVVNWDVLVQLKADGTARSAAAQGHANITGYNDPRVESTDQSLITVRNGGRSLHFEGGAWIQPGILNSSQHASCTADYQFPNPKTTVYKYPSR